MAAPDGTAVAPVVETPQAPAPTPSTLENLEENVDNQLNSTTGESAAPADGSQAPVDPSAATDLPAEGTPPAEADGKNERVLQQNAAMKLAFQHLGINADSPVIEQINNGLLTRDQILGTPVVQPVAPAIPPAPTVTTEQRLANIDKIVAQEGDVSADDFRGVIGQIKDVVSDVVRENAQLKQARDQDQRETLSDRTARVTTDVFDEIAAGLPAEVKAIAQEAFQGMVDNKVWDLAADPNVGQQRALSVDGYKFAAQQLAPQFAALVAAIQGNPAPVVTAPVPPQPIGAPATPGAVQPLAPGGGIPSPAPPAPKGTFTIENLEDNANRYMANQTLRVGA